MSQVSSSLTKGTKLEKKIRKGDLFNVAALGKGTKGFNKPSTPHPQIHL